MKKLIFFLLLIGMARPGHSQEASPGTVVLDKALTVTPITGHTYLHTSLLHLEDGSTFPCNGLIYVDNGEAFLFDTPVNDSLTVLLVNWITTSLQATVKGVVVNHFHIDCLGGLKALKDLHIPSYAHHKCIELASRAGTAVPEYGIIDSLTLSVGNQRVSCRYFGEAHAPDNISCWLPAEKLLFGGCMIKSVGAQKGNLSDANLEQWPLTVKKIKRAYPDVKIVVPGHGPYGDASLLDYTIRLFSE